jgi:hypothetical protein
LATRTSVRYLQIELSPISDSQHYDAEAEAIFHLGRTQKVNKSNMLTSIRITESFAAYGDEFEKVPTLLTDKVALVVDSNLEPSEKGRSYLAEKALFNPAMDPFYAYTINETIYQHILEEVNQSITVPCGLYFCCHGGEGAHTGISHDDYVDIRLAWFLVGCVFAAIAFMPSANCCCALIG